MLPKNLLSLARRGLHSKTRTFYSPTPDFLHEYLSQDSLPSGSLSVFMLSTSLPNLPGHLSVLQAAFPNSIGSFSVSPPGSEPTVSLATFWGTDIKVFKSDLTGRAPAEVGRFQRPERQRSVPPEDRRGSTSRDVDAAYGQGWEKLWNGEVQNERIAELEGVQADTFLLLSDSRPAPVLRALDNMFPKAIKTGILTAPTPFITNRPNTLLHNGTVIQSGSIGIAIKGLPSVYKTDFGLEPMLEPVTVTSAKGNMLLEIDGVNSNPTQVLINAIQQRGGTGLTKEEEFYLGFLDNGFAYYLQDVKRVVRILSGDPSRGAMSLDMESSIKAGQVVQFMHRAAISQNNLPLVDSIILTSLSRTEQMDSHLMGVPRVTDGFIASSEDGFIYSNPLSSICTAPNATTTISWGPAII
ncbi:hypothetical protein C347_03762 [Cryptococcus neoformans AD2-60a]|uniref:FIST domain-containing protein n=1 Tax=Cryptococcus neoformans Tu259-1 TaxID=1230072 RepID=A0A854QA39_CRYNE|nr:hypothetical protein C347_03762 [Cryptococcus neoformans var. grubii AD2-60a]OWZ41397.1 hypothetical protein C353_03607 [Cryptococcus neoformans var. grubii AD1-83a]OWZ53948.1 hypothetical protein C368_03702 [Cryptococcus neoformans var. grubii 125.91]OXG19850.1 hypothetical protein C361_03910 [Cryptococcus neoformans var. grubii Tu259-1]OXG32008.1 hypothetical protein C360_04276 [Cryptococcus neoformans var. grubii Bt15]OXG39784.1 hypothetical protein C359_03702 [Cryptococcus neoformans va